MKKTTSKSAKSRGATTTRSAKTVRGGSLSKSPHGRSAVKTMRVATDRVVKQYDDALTRLKTK